MPPVRKNKGKTAKQNEEVVSAPVVSGQLDKKLKKQAQKKQQKIAKERGLVFIKHLPHGFFEKQLKEYFAQFGSVTNVRLSRSKRTGGSKGFAFVEFDVPEVAQVAAETMNNYLMFKKVTKASYIPPNEQRFNYFKTSVKKIKNKIGKEKFVSNTTMNIQRKVKEQNDWCDESYQKRTESNLLKLKKLNAKYAHLGIDFSKFAVEPKLCTAEEEEDQSTAEPAKKKSKKEQPTKKAAVKSADKLSLLETVATMQKNQEKKNNKKAKAIDKSLQLEDLLGNTIAEDSDDDEYKPVEGEEDDEASSDEETYGFTKSDSSEEEDDDDDDEEEDGAEEESVPKSKSSNNKRFEQMLKRKPHSGAIQKFSKKSLKKPSTTIVAKTKKTALVAEATKKAAKPLQSFKKGMKKSAAAKRSTV